MRSTLLLTVDRLDLEQVSDGRLMRLMGVVDSHLAAAQAENGRTDW